MSPVFAGGCQELASVGGGQPRKAGSG